jgi:PBS lyase HEAT-like repeat
LFALFAVSTYTAMLAAHVSARYGGFQLFKKLLFQVLTILMVANCIATFSRAAPKTRTVIAAETQRINGELSSKRRSDDSERLAKWVRQNKAAVTDIDDVELIASLLTDKDDLVRYWAAMALGYIGPFAISAVPALNRALYDTRCDRAGKTSASGIIFALSQMGITAKEVDCTSLSP